MEQTLHNIFDSHAHYDAGHFKKDRDALLSGLPARGVSYVMNAATDLASARASVAMAEKYDFIYCCVGFHPHEAAKAHTGFTEKLRLLAAHPKVRAIGEIGLDYHYEFTARTYQQEVFEKQILFANELDMPVIVHDREAHSDTLRLLKRYRPAGVMHCYSGSAEMAKELLDIGMYIGFAGVVTFKNARRALDVLRVVPAERLLIETDCPYLAPEPMRGHRCDSGMLSYTAEAIAKELGMRAQELVDITTRNALKLFRI